MALIELNKFSLSPEKKGTGILKSDVCIEKGEIIQMRTDSMNDAHLLFKGLATLSYPSGGSYLFDGNKMNYSDYRNLLSSKKKIGYLTSGAALISNRSIRENLCMGQVYFDNDLSMSLDDEAVGLCRDFGVDYVLEDRPTILGVAEQKRAILVRELQKKPKLMLMEFPRAFSGHRYKTLMMERIHGDIQKGMVLIYLSFDADFVHEFQGKCLEIKEGHATLYD